jgi:hypothetical protein
MTTDIRSNKKGQQGPTPASVLTGANSASVAPGAAGNSVTNPITVNNPARPQDGTGREFASNLQSMYASAMGGGR